MYPPDDDQISASLISLNDEKGERAKKEGVPEIEADDDNHMTEHDDGVHHDPGD